MNIIKQEIIELDIIGKVVIVKQINFKESICKPCKELFDKGYIDITKPAIFGNVLGDIRFSNYLPDEEVGEIIMRLKEYYDVGYTEAFILCGTNNLYKNVQDLYFQEFEQSRIKYNLKQIREDIKKVKIIVTVPC